MSAVARAFVEILADDSQFRAASARVQSSTEQMQRRLEGVGRAASLMLVASGGAIAGLIKLAADQEQATRRLDAALAASGQSTVQWSQELYEAANRIQDLTVHGNEGIQGLMAYATSLGITADALEDTTKQALGLAAAYGIDQQRAIRALVRAREGNINALKREIPELENVQSETEALAIIQSRATAGWEMAQAEVDTMTGQLKQLKNTLGDVGKTLGSALLPSVSGLVGWIQKTIAPLEGWAAANQRLITTLTGLSVATLGVAAVLPRLVATIRATITVVGALRAAVVALTAKLTLLQSVTIVGLVAALGGLVWSLGSTAAAANDTSAAIDRLRQSTEAYRQALDELAAAQRTMDRAVMAGDADGEVAATRRRIAALQQLQEQILARRPESQTFEEMFPGLTPTPDLVQKWQQLQDTLGERQQISDNAFRGIQDQIDELEQRAASLQQQVARVGESTGRPFAPMLEGIDRVRNAMHGLDREGGDFWSRMEAGAKRLRQTMLDQFANLGDDVFNFTAEPWEAQAEAMRREADELIRRTQQIANISSRPFGQAMLSPFGIDPLGNDEAAERIADIQKALTDRLREMSPAWQRAQQIIEQTRTPAERFADAIAEINDLMRAGHLDADAAERAREQARERRDMEEDAGVASPSPQTPQFVGLQDMFNRIQQSITGDQDDLERQTAQNTKRSADAVTKQTRLAEQGNKLLGQVIGNLADLGKRIERLGTYGR